MTRITATSPRYTIHATGLTSRDVRSACRAIAWTRYSRRCDCEPDVGFTCWQCAREGAAHRQNVYDVEDLIEAYADWLFRMIVKKEEPKP